MLPTEQELRSSRRSGPDQMQTDQLFQMSMIGSCGQPILRLLIALN
jgi:hypothetical protein